MSGTLLSNQYSGSQIALYQASGIQGPGAAANFHSVWLSVMFALSAIQGHYVQANLVPLTPYVPSQGDVASRSCGREVM